MKRPFSSTTYTLSSFLRSPSTQTSSIVHRPAPPKIYLESFKDRKAIIDFPKLPATTQLKAKLGETESKREEVQNVSRTLDRQLNAIRGSLERTGKLSDDTEVAEFDLSGLLNVICANSNNSSNKKDDSSEKEQMFNSTIDRPGNLSYKMEDLIRLKCYIHFFDTGRLMSLAHINDDGSILFSDEEYLAGAIDFTRDLSRYCVGQGSVRDITSIEMARDITTQLFSSLLKFDFRNGNLRRKYDSVKYSLKRIETILYELSITGDSDAADDVSKDTTQVSKKMKMERVDEAELEKIRKRMEERDEKRERIIKRCRDSQKAAKRAIFALHRGDVVSGEKLISECEDVANELMPIIQEDPTLRYGSFSNSLEEYAEANLYKIWLKEHRLGTIEDMPLINEDEYIGGLCDLTGEIVRYAVAQGTKRDEEAVQFSLATNLTILTWLQEVPFSYKLNKKMDPLRQSVSKLENMIYEMSLRSASGGVELVTGGMDLDEEKPATRKDHDEHDEQ